MEKRLDLARWTPAGFELTEWFARHLFESAQPDELREMLPGLECRHRNPMADLRDPSRTLRLLPAGAGDTRWPPDAARLVVIGTLRTGDVADLVRYEFVAPQWERRYRVMLGHEEDTGSPYRETPTLHDSITLDATAPGWQEGDVVAVVGEE